MGRKKTILLKGVSKRTYTFNIYPWDSQLVCSGMVYAVLRRDRFGYSVIYVGITSMLHSHISEHPLLMAFDEAEKTHIGVHAEPSVLIRQLKQRDLVENFSPGLNKDQ